MSILEIENFKQSKRKGFPRGIIFIIALILSIIGYTLAANISLNSGQNVEFGQGVTQTSACDDEITVTPQAEFINTSGDNEFKFSSVQISGIDSTSDNCDGKDFIIKAYDSAGNLLDIFSDNESDYASLRIWDVGGSFILISDGSAAGELNSAESNAEDLTSTSFDITFTTPVAAAENVYRITVESVNHVGDSNFITFNGHIYQIINDPMSWQAAYEDITTPVGGECAYQLYGMCGYFANITSEEEKEFIIANLGLNETWLGGSDLEEEGTWSWIDGPEFGTNFWTGTSGGTLITYANWASGEPNQSGDEDALQSYSWGNGLWNDLNAISNTLPYVVEFSPNFTSRTNYLDLE